MLKIRRPLGRLIFNMGIAIPGKTVFLIETTPWVWALSYSLYIQWNLHNETREVSPKTRKFHHLPGTILTNHVYSIPVMKGHLSWDITKFGGHFIFLAANLSLAGFPEPTLSVKICILGVKRCLIYAFVTQQPFGIPSRNLGTCIFVASTICVFDSIVVSALVLAVLTIVCIRAAYKWSSVVWTPHASFTYAQRA